MVARMVDGSTDEMFDVIDVMKKNQINLDHHPQPTKISLFLCFQFGGSLGGVCVPQRETNLKTYFPYTVNKQTMVKFAAHLRDELRREGWEAFYIKYKPLKKLLKKITNYEEKADIVEAVKVRQNFVDQLETNMREVEAFFLLQTSKLAEHGERVSTLMIKSLRESVDGDVYNPSLVVRLQAAQAKARVKAKLAEKEEEKEEKKEKEEKEGKEGKEGKAVEAKEKDNQPNSASTTTSTTTESTDTTEVEAVLDENTVVSLEMQNEISEKFKSSLETVVETVEEKRMRRSIEACDAMNDLVAYRREIDAIVKYSAVNCEAVRKIVKKHDKNALDIILQPRILTFIKKFLFYNARSNKNILSGESQKKKKKIS